MIMISSNAQNDIYLAADGNLAMATGLAGVMQACAHAAKAQLGEMIYAIDKGVPNFQTVWKNTANVAQFEAYLRLALEEVQDVTEVQQLDVRVENNVLSYVAIIKTIYGEGTVNG